MILNRRIIIMNYKSLVNQTRDNIEYTAHAINDSIALLMVAMAGILSALPESVALYLSTVDKVPYGATVTLSAALPSVSVACVYVAVTTGGFNRYWTLFFFQLCASGWITRSMGGTWEIALIIITGIGAWIASEAYNASRKERKDDKVIDHKLEQEAKDAETKRQIKLMKEQAKLTGQSDRTSTGHPSNKDKAAQMASEGLSQSEIAQMLGVTDRTVRRYLSDVRPDNVHLNGVTR